MKRFLIYYFVFLLSFLSFFASGVLDSQDGLQYLSVARNIYYLHKPVAPPYEYNIDKNINMNIYKGKDGNWYSDTGLGYSAAMLPAVFITDMVYKFYNITPPVHFPLESDWLILLLASFTNCFFGALLGVTLFVYLLDLGLSKKSAFFLSFASMVCTNLFAYSKNSFAHMMFTSFLFLSFFFLRKYVFKREAFYIIASGVAFGISAISYNQTIILAIPSYILYYLLLEKPSFKKFKELGTTAAKFIAGVLPFILLYIWFEKTIALPSGDSASLKFVVNTASSIVHIPPLSFIFEGIYGNLLSPGRSIFLYSPILLVILIFWHKLKQSIKPEFFSFLLLAICYVGFYAIPHSYSEGLGYVALWHGELSWGPRYMLPLIPFGILVAGSIYKELSKKARLFVFYPFLLVGLYIEILGVVIPYQIKLQDLDPHFFVNKTEYTSYLYSDLLPRYTPVFSMTRNLIKTALLLPKTLNHGIYNTRLYDGIDFPFNVGSERWRVIEGTGHIAFDNNQKDTVKSVTFGLVNQIVKDSSSSASLSFNLNGQSLESKPTTLLPQDRKIIQIPVEQSLLKDKNNQLEVSVSFSDPNTTKHKSQIIGLTSFGMNNHPVNLESLDFPYLSSLGPAMTGAKYQTYQSYNIDPWRSWNIHTQIYQTVPDFWWLKAFYYWDIPKGFFVVLLLIEASVAGFFGIKIFKRLN